MNGSNGVVYSLLGLLGVLISANTAVMLAQFQALRSEMTARFAAVDTRFDGVDRRLDGLDRDVQALTTRVFRDDR